MDHTVAIGRIVHFRVKDVCLPAIIVKLWSEQTINLVALSDLSSSSVMNLFHSAPIHGFTSVTQGQENGQWHWPDECEEQK